MKIFRKFPQQNQERKRDEEAKRESDVSSVITRTREEEMLQQQQQQLREAGSRGSIVRKMLLPREAREEERGRQIEWRKSVRAREAREGEWTGVRRQHALRKHLLSLPPCELRLLFPPSHSFHECRFILLTTPLSAVYSRDNGVQKQTSPTSQTVLLLLACVCEETSAGTDTWVTREGTECMRSRVS